MILTKIEIISRIKEGTLGFTPFDSLQLGAHGIDLRLGFTFLLPRRSRLTKTGHEAISVDSVFSGYGFEQFDTIELEQGQYFDLPPGGSVVASGLESIKMPLDIMAFLFPRSSVSRRGVSVDSGIVGAGYEGHLTIPIRNSMAHVARLYPGERFCQIIFQELKSEAESYKSRYQNRDIAEGIRAEQDEEHELIRNGNIKDLKKRFSV